MAERARHFKKQKFLARQRDQKEVQIQQARAGLNEYRPGVFLDLTSADICAHGFTRAYKGAKLEGTYHKLQNMIMGLLASSVEHAQSMGLEHELAYALEFSRAGGKVVLGSEHMYDETNQRLSVPPQLMNARVLASRGIQATSQERVKNVSCSVLVREGSVHFEYVPPPGSASDVEEFGSLGVRKFVSQPWIMRPCVLHGKTAPYLMQALSSDWPLHVWSLQFPEIWDRYLRHGVAVWVDVDNRDDARTNQAYVAQASGAAEKFFHEAGCPDRYVKLSHRCDIHQASRLSSLSHVPPSGGQSHSNDFLGPPPLPLLLPLPPLSPSPGPRPRTKTIAFQ